MGQTYQRDIRPGELGTGNPEQYDYDRIAAFMQGANAVPLGRVARAYLHAKYAFEQTEARLAQHVKQLNLVWQGGAQELGVVDLRLLTEAAGTFAAASQKFADAMDSGSTVVQKSRHTMPGPSTSLGVLRPSNSITDLARKRADDRAAQQHLAKTNAELATAFAQIPSEITIDLPNQAYRGTGFGGGETAGQLGGPAPGTASGGTVPLGSAVGGGGMSPIGSSVSAGGGAFTPGGLETVGGGDPITPPEQVPGSRSTPGAVGVGNSSDLSGAGSGPVPPGGAGMPNDSEGMAAGGQRPGNMPRPSPEMPTFSPPVAAGRPVLPGASSGGPGTGAPGAGRTTVPQHGGAAPGRATGSNPSGPGILRPGGVLGTSPITGAGTFQSGSSAPAGRFVPSSGGVFGPGTGRLGAEGGRVPVRGVLDGAESSVTPRSSTEQPSGQGRGAHLSGMPMGAGVPQGREQQERDVQLTEEEDLWSDDSTVAPRIIGGQNI